MKKNSDPRTMEQIREHYVVEKELAKKLKSADREKRRYLYTEVYKELFQRVPHHPLLMRKKDAEDTYISIYAQMQLLKHFLDPDTTFLELGPGDCALSLEVAKHVQNVYAVDVTPGLIMSDPHPENFTWMIFDGCKIPLCDNSVNIVYSNQVIEHIHPDDAIEQAQDIYRVLVPGGIYVCLTANRLSGPHDVSCYFDEIAVGFHLKEYTNIELAQLFDKVGFSKVKLCIGVKGKFVITSIVPARWCENVLMRLPKYLGKRLAGYFPLRSLLGVKLLAIK